MIDKDYDAKIFYLTCDCCGQDNEEFDMEDGWSNMISEMKLSGWRFKCEEDGNWIHQCPECFANKVEW